MTSSGPRATPAGPSCRATVRLGLGRVVPVKGGRHAEVDGGGRVIDHGERRATDMAEMQEVYGSTVGATGA
jgi:hypothetical protein